jgi:apolipoprotein D and lipocalin family protein
LLSIVAALLLVACTGVPDGITPVSDFALERYLGTWYEIARLDHSFERGLSRVTAEYAAAEDGGISVVNRGYSNAEREWSQAEGRAYFVDTPDIGHLKVSFFGPFYASYVIFELDPEYQYAFVSGYDKSYLWLLARSPKVAPELIERFLERARALGFDTDELILVEH